MSSITAGLARAVLVLGLLATAPVFAATPHEREPEAAPLKLIQREMMSEERNERVRDRAERIREARRRRARKPGQAIGGETRGRGSSVLQSQQAFRLRRERGLDPSWAPKTAGVTLPRVDAVAPNVGISNPAQDAGIGAAGQSETAIAVWGDHVLAAWNDGAGFGANTSLQGYGYSNDGGTSFVDGGVLPPPAGSQWTSDPVLTVNEKTGEFYYCGLIGLPNFDSQTANGVGIARGTFTGSSFAWDTPRIVRTVPTSSDFLDKPWVAVDSLSGNLYVTYTHFTSTSDSVIFQRSLNQGVSWGPKITLNTDEAASWVQGSRPAVGPNGEVYAVWKEIGRVDADFMRIRRSSDRGASFASEVTVASFFDDFSTGAPGFNRERGIAFPTIAVDRGTGPNRGRVYVGWNESLNWFDEADALAPTAIRRGEVEPNFARSATPFVIGQTLNGQFTSTDFEDWYSFTATQGQSYIFFADSIPRPLYRMHVMCTDTLTRLTYSGDLDSPAGGRTPVVWTAPTTGTYYFRMVFFAGNVGGYRVLTGTAVTGGGDRGRDMRDVFVASSSNGASWTTPVRVNNDPARYDNWLPEVAVTPEGDVYATWFDWRDAPANRCGGVSQIYVARSQDAGGSWTNLGALTDAASDWTNSNSNIVPNQGDYNALFANARGVYAAWGDARRGNPDVFGAVITLLPDTLRILVTGTEVANDHVTITWHAATRNIQPHLERQIGDDGFLDLGIQPIAADSTIQYLDTDVRRGERYTYRFRITIAGNDYTTGLVSVVTPTPKITFGRVQPNPMASTTVFGYDLPEDGVIEILVFDASGRVVRSVTNEFQTAGAHEATWDARDDHGELVHAGIYFARLAQNGRTASHRVALVP